VDDRSALMAAIIANPEEDTPRLALADWLQEHGDKHDQARAEYIRLQIQTAAAGKVTAQVKRLLAQASALWKAHARHWLGGLWVFTADERDRDFRRGLLDWWYTTAGNFLKKPHQKAVCEWFPRVGIDRLALNETTKRVQQLAASPALAWATTFHWFDARIEDDGFVALATSPHLARISRLVIDKPRCSDAGLKAIANSPGLPNLRVLGLHDGLWRGRFTDAGLRVLLNSNRQPKLCELDLSGAQTHAVGGRSLFTCPALSRLRTLRVGFDTNQHWLAVCPHLTSLEELWVSDSKMSDKEARLLADNPALTRTRRVSLSNMNSSGPPLSAKAEQALRDRFGDGFSLTYSVLCRRS
jgi:uncharacterized protein (TIGR02996 family)